MINVTNRDVVAILFSQDKIEVGGKVSEDKAGVFSISVDRSFSIQTNKDKLVGKGIDEVVDYIESLVYGSND